MEVRERREVEEAQEDICWGPNHASEVLQDHMVSQYDKFAALFCFLVRADPLVLSANRSDSPQM